jgi:GNAT superfamily N-acetyltransferase
MELKILSESDIDLIISAFADVNWIKPRSTFEEYLREQQSRERIIWLAFLNNDFVGYCTLKWKSLYQPFARAHIPEIIDLNVLPRFRNHGIASYLLDVAEQEAQTKSSIVGIGVGLYSDYGAAQRLYIKRGYVPDGRGVTYDYQNVPAGENIYLDDDLVLWLIRQFD